MITVREYTNKDIADMLRVRSTAIVVGAKEYYAETVVLAWVAAMNEQYFIDNEDNIYLVAEDQGAIVGFANCTLDGKLSGLYVDPDVTGVGVGSALIDTVESRLSLLEVERVYTFASLNAQSFYEKMGYRFVQKKNHTFASGGSMEVVEMEKVLQSDYR